MTENEARARSWTESRQTYRRRQATFAKRLNDSEGEESRAVRAQSYRGMKLFLAWRDSRTAHYTALSDFDHVRLPGAWKVVEEKYERLGPDLATEEADGRVTVRIRDAMECCSEWRDVGTWAAALESQGLRHGLRALMALIDSP